MVKCKACGFKVIEGSIKVDGEWYCYDCASGKFETCNGCHNYFYEDDLTLAFVDKDYNNEVYVCPECLEKYYVECKKCNEYLDKKVFGYNGNGEFICPECKEEG